MIPSPPTPAQPPAGASHDSLTGLPNRQLFTHTLARQLPAAWPRASALLLIDLDGFRAINDLHGHVAGDAVLRQFARRLGLLAPARAAIGRLGNDEFALLLPALAQLRQAGEVAELIRTALHQPFDLPGGPATLTACIGIAACPADTDDAATLLRYAGLALQQARRAGRDRCCHFTDAMQCDARDHHQLEHALRHACAQGEFELYYQPKVRIDSGRITGAEALLRWNRPGHGQVAPSEFLPLLERSGLIVPVGAWVIDQACRRIAAWAALGERPLGIAVNVASRQFADTRLEDIVAQALARHGIAPGLLSLEVTESAMMDDPGRTAATLAALRAMGVRIAIDDFGTGYSSLAYLKRFPVDALKIDISFIRDVTSNPDDAAVVDTIIAMAHSLKLEVVAEGVETEAQLAYLGRQRCDQIQGYHYSRPLPAAQLEGLLRDDLRLGVPEGVGTVAERTLLIIDDEPNVLSALQRLLRADGYRVLAANGAAQALALLARHPVQLILCDQHMAEMRGTELLDQVRQMYPDTFRIILTGHNDLGAIMEAVHRGALYRFYTKPWDNRTLRENIGAAFRHYWQLHGLAEPAPMLAAGG
ncbi:EAL domain-containing protein [Duganella sp. BJB1802]|uniref:EAL domain-containing protein n=1 Tax=Duganella sp. BJB1802 TaxID=2744575 RepID=UPI001592FA8F|nr:EAL domain-containing protein [Duganella sp. BJB1802]NVD74513.1 EAL domain-containing protein [Duganella sp. BJB1802]